MANPVKGEVDLVAGDKTYVMRLGTNALIEIGTVLGGIDPDELGPLLMDPKTRPQTVRAVLWGAIGGSRSGLSLFDAGDLIDEYPEEIGKAINEVFLLGMPEAPKGEDRNPPEPGSRGTGKQSSNAGSRSPASQKTSSGH